MHQIATPNAPAAIGPYCQATVHNGIIFTSGQIPLDPADGNIVGATIEEQAHRQACPQLCCGKNTSQKCFGGSGMHRRCRIILTLSCEVRI